MSVRGIRKKNGKLPKIQVTESQVQKMIRDEYVTVFGRNNGRGHKIAVPNIFFFEWESDLLTITKSNRIWEFEIKTSKSDFRADSKKEGKHSELHRMQDLSAIPNRFYYVCPDDIGVTVDDLPDYAGLIHIKRYGMNKYLKTVLKAPELHREEIDPNTWETIAKKQFYKTL